MIDIAALTCNRKRITELFIRQLKTRTITPHRLIVMDNGSQDGTAELLVKLYAEGLIDKLALLNENTGVHFGFNRLLAVVKSSPYYICTDADLIPCSPIDGKDWLSRLIELADANQEYGAIACRPHILIGEPPDRFDGCGEIREMSHVGAHLRIMRVDAVRECGGWKKEKSPSRNNEDWFIAAQLKKLGLKVGYSSQIRCIHEWGRPELGEDHWGYPSSMSPADHGHRDIWPPVSAYNWDNLDVSWETCEPVSRK